MATVFAPPPLLRSEVPTSPTQSRVYNSPYTPPSPSDSPEVNSPVSPRNFWNVPAHLQAQSRQLRPPKSPMYVPAVLRPTEKPARHSPPKANNVSFGRTEGLPDVDGAVPAGDGAVKGVSRVGTDEWNAQVLGPVTGLPSRNHWKPDSASVKCDDPACDKTFSFFERRHHCRRCGKIYCADHSSHSVPLDQHARFHSHATKHRACNACWTDYRTWEVARVSRSNSTNSRDSTNPSTPNVPVMRPNRASNLAQKFGNLAHSFGGAQDWSTF